MSNTNIDHGSTFVVIDDDKYELQFTLKAVKAIDTHFKGLINALQSVNLMSPQAVAAVVTFGAGLPTKQKDVESLEWAIMLTGVSKVASEVTPYLMAMLNPGNKSDDEIEQEAEAGNE